VTQNKAPPTFFLNQYITIFRLLPKFAQVAQKLALLMYAIFKNLPKVCKQPPNWRKFAQSGLPDGEHQL
jgi:hypothetical protein